MTIDEGFHQIVQSVEEAPTEIDADRQCDHEAEDEMGARNIEMTEIDQTADEVQTEKKIEIVVVHVPEVRIVIETVALKIGQRIDAHVTETMADEMLKAIAHVHRLTDEIVHNHHAMKVDEMTTIDLWLNGKMKK